MKNLAVSEAFYSIQGEGASTGVPAVFLRLGGCNLLCKSEQWTCDTIDVWSKSKSTLFEEVLKDEWVEQLRAGAHLVVTGGEPLAHKNLSHFLFWFNLRNHFLPFTEVETNGTIAPPPYLRALVHQWNCSPKLSTSGAGDKRLNVEALKSLIPLNTYFKFVISCKQDAKEVFTDYSFLPKSRLIFMPAGDTRDLLNKTRPLVAELCKENNIRYGDRLHIVLWDKKTGV
jgi:organic radical activating enzyme